MADPFSIIMGAQLVGDILNAPQRRKNKKLQTQADNRNLFGVDKYVPKLQHGNDKNMNFIESASRKVDYENRTKI